MYVFELINAKSLKIILKKQLFNNKNYKNININFPKLKKRYIFIKNKKSNLKLIVKY